MSVPAGSHFGIFGGFHSPISRLRVTLGAASMNPGPNQPPRHPQRPPSGKPGGGPDDRAHHTRTLIDPGHITGGLTGGHTGHLSDPHATGHGTQIGRAHV